MRLQGLLFAVGLLALGVPLLLLVSSNIARTLGRLTEEAERISRLEMDSTQNITSHIDEVDRLGDAVSHMYVFFKISDKIFKMRVPAEVEQEGLDEAEVAVIGYPEFSINKTHR